MRAFLGYISDCASVISDKRIMYYGGYINTDAVVSKESRYPEISSTLTEIDLSNNKAKHFLYVTVFLPLQAAVSLQLEMICSWFKEVSKCINAISDKVFHADARRAV